jgi:hypothetical protein
VDDPKFDSEKQVSDDLIDPGPTPAVNSAGPSPSPGVQRDAKHKNGRRGPRTQEGKANSSKNARRHAIFSPDPTAGGESPGEYEALLAGMRDKFRPVNVYEEELIAQLTGEWIALHRITREISALINVRTAKIDPPPRVSLIKPIKQDMNWSAYRRPFEALSVLEHLELCNERSTLDPEIVGDIMRAIEAVVPEVPSFEIRDGPPTTVASVCLFFTALAEANDVELTVLITDTKKILRYVFDLAMGAEDKVNRIRKEQAERDDRRRGHISLTSTSTRSCCATSDRANDRLTGGLVCSKSPKKIRAKNKWEGRVKPKANCSRAREMLRAQLVEWCRRPCGALVLQMSQRSCQTSTPPNELMELGRLALYEHLIVSHLLEPDGVASGARVPRRQWGYQRDS